MLVVKDIEKGETVEFYRPTTSQEFQSVDRKMRKVIAVNKAREPYCKEIWKNEKQETEKCKPSNK